MSNGADLLGEIAGWFRRFVFTVSDSEHDLLALWTVHTHLAVECYTTPRLQLDSPIPGSGKTTVLEHFSRLCLHPVTMASVSSPALLARMLHAGPRTMLIDEADRTLSPDRNGVDELLAVLNSGYKRGATRPTLVPVKGGGWEAEEMPTFAPVAIAGNNPNLPDDTRTRMIRVLLLPDMDCTADESDWEVLDDDAAELAGRIAAWADEIREQVRSNRPSMPPGITGRFREKWSPLRRVADAASGRWPEVVNAMAIADKEQYAMDKEDGMIREKPALLLLRHLAEVWPVGVTFAPTETLLGSLIGGYPSSWGKEGPFGKALTAKRLARMLATSYKVNSTRIANSGPRGYLTADLEPVWRQMGMRTPHPVEAVDPAHVVNPVNGSPHSPDEPHAPDSQEALPDLEQTGDTCQQCGKHTTFSLIDGKCRTCATAKETTP